MENIREEDESLKLPNMTFEPAVKLHGPTCIVPKPPEPATKILHDEGGKFGKNLIYSTREKIISESVHVQESNLLP